MNVCIIIVTTIKYFLSLSLDDYLLIICWFAAINDRCEHGTDSCHYYFLSHILYTLAILFSQFSYFPLFLFFYAQCISIFSPHVGISEISPSSIKHGQKLSIIEIFACTQTNIWLKIYLSITWLIEGFFFFGKRDRK